MKKHLFLILFTFVYLQSLIAQNKSDILIVDSNSDISFPTDKLVKKVSVRRGFIKKTKANLIQQCIDSTQLYGGNCFKVTYYDENESNVITKWQFHDYIRGDIYALNEAQILDLQKSIEKNKVLNEKSVITYRPPRRIESLFIVQEFHKFVDNYKSYKEEEPEITYKSQKNNDSLKIVYEANFVFQYGGETKLALIFPKINLLRKHKFSFASPYYGVELALEPAFIAGYGSLSAIVGVEKNIFNLETSMTYFKTTEVSDGRGGFNGPYSQNLLNLKLGIKMNKVRLKFGTSFILDQNIPEGQNKINSLDFAKINNIISGVELQIKFCGN